MKNHFNPVSYKVTTLKDTLLASKHKLNIISVRKMGLPKLFDMCLWVILLSSAANGDMFLVRHRDAIENFIMTGYGKGWKNCDLITDAPQGPGFLKSNPLYVMEVDHLKNFDISTSLSSSHCILISFYVKSNQSLSDLIEFGWTTIQHKRLALVLKMGPGLSLDMAANITKLPFVIATELWNGQPQFLCPVVGEAEPHLQDYSCDPSIKNKILRVAGFGLPPNVFGNYNLNC